MPRSGPLRRQQKQSMMIRRNRRADMAMLQPRRSAQITSARLQKVGDIKAPIWPAEAWQRDAFGYYETVGEVAYSLSEVAKTLARCEIRPIEIDAEAGPGAVKETTDERVLRVWDAFRGERGGKMELYRKAALGLSIAGECHLIGIQLYDEITKEPAGITWKFCSVDEIRVEGQGRDAKIKQLYGNTGQQPEELPDDTYIARLYQSDPRFEDRADCALKHVLPICQEVVLLTQVVDAIAKSRLNAGILYVPDEMSFGPYSELEDDSDETDDTDPFTKEIIEQFVAPVENRASAASLVPLILRGPAEYADKVKLIEVARNLDQLYQELRLEAIKRVVTGLEIPMELLFGKGGLNHWTGYNVDAEFVNKHIAPLGEMIAEFLTDAYLHMMLEEEEDMTEEEARNFRLIFDPTPVISKTDQSANARAAYDRREMTPEAFMKEQGFDESDMPTTEQKKERDLRELMYAEPVIYGPQIMGMLYPELKDVITIPGLDQTGVPGGFEPGDTPGNPAGAPERKNPTGPNSDPINDQDTGQDEPPKPRGPAGGGPSGSPVEQGLVDRLAATGDAALERALQRAGNLLLAKMQDDVAMQKRYADVEPDELVSKISEKDLRALKIDTDELWQGAWYGLADRVKAVATEHFVAQDEMSLVADKKAEQIVRAYIPGVQAVAQNAVSNPDAPRFLPIRFVADAVKTHERVLPWDKE